MAAKKPFTESEQKLLKRNLYTYQVTAQEIHFTTEFKQTFWDLYRSGTSAVLAMRQLGYDTDLLGKERIRGIRTAVQRQALSQEDFRTGYKPYQKRRRHESIDGPNAETNVERDYVPLIKLDGHSRYYLRWESRNATGKCGLRR